MPFPWGRSWHAWRDVSEAYFRGKSRLDVRARERELLTKMNDFENVAMYEITSRFGAGATWENYILMNGNNSSEEK